MTRSLRKKLLLILVISVFIVGSLGVFYIYTAQDNTRTINCNDLKQRSQQERCWAETIESIIQHKGVNKAFDTIVSRFLVEPSFKGACYEVLHEVGHWAYHYTMHNNIEFDIPPKVTLCGNGFDRGFIHELTAMTGDFEKAVDFCTDPQLSSESLNATARCYHGIGHGALVFYGQRMWGEEQTMIAQALKECEKNSDTPDQLDYCAGGVFSEIVKSYQTSKYGVSLNEKDLFSVCREQAELYKNMCYRMAKPLLLWFTNGDFIKAASFVEDIVEDEHAIVAMRSLASAVAMRSIKKNTNISDYADDIFACRELQERLHRPCIEGLVRELLAHGTPELEDVDAMNFCQLTVLSEKEQKACVEYIASEISKWNPQNKI